MSCPFCDPPRDRIFFDSEGFYCLWDGFPVAEGHALVIPKRHFSSWFEATPGELGQLIEGIDHCRSEILESRQPSGFNIGVNVGEVAGQTIPHLHVHVIPRYIGDVIDPRGGVRYVIPEKGNYLEDRVSEPSIEFQSDLVFGGEFSPLKDAMSKDLALATHLDIAVAFITEAGLHEIKPDVMDLFERGGTVVRKNNHAFPTLRTVSWFQPVSCRPR